MSTSSELTHLFRALKAPAAARALPKLAERARTEEWSYERFAQALLSTEQSSREAHGGEGRIRAARFPARKTLEEFDFTFQRSVKKQVIEHLGQLDFLHERSNIVALGPPGTGKTHLAVALAIRACLAGQRVIFRTATEWVALLADAQRQGRLDDELRRLERLPAARLRRGWLHPVRPPGRQPDVHARQPPLRTREPDRHEQQAVQRLGRDLRRRRHRRGDDRPLLGRICKDESTRIASCSCERSAYELEDRPACSRY